MFALLVRLTARREHRDELFAAVRLNAEASILSEPNCLYFGICQEIDDPNRVVLYEVYTDEEAYQLHRRTPHFAEWRKAADKYSVDGSQKNTAAVVVFSRQRLGMR